MKNKTCVIIPTHNHFERLPLIISKLASHQLHVIIVNDGSNDETRQTIWNLEQRHVNLESIHLPYNQGKGVAVLCGLRKAHALGFTHAIQIDADGQHDLTKLNEFIRLSEATPNALISGKPIYDESIPKARKIGRWFTHVWVWIETLSFKISDSMCGLRIYPIQATLEITKSKHIGLRMDFDTEIMVRMHWQGTPVLMVPVNVHYPVGNLSNFNLWADNLRITKMHFKLVLEMVFNFKQIYAQKPKYHQTGLQSANTWNHLEEQGSYLALKIVNAFYRLFGRNICLMLGLPVVLYYYWRAKEQRQASQEYLYKIFTLQSQSKKHLIWHGFKHFMHFYAMVLDKIAVWDPKNNTCRLDTHYYQLTQELIQKNEGFVLMVSHLGNIEVCRALLENEQKRKLHILLHTKNSKQWMKLLNEINPQVNLNLIEVSDITPDTALYLKEKIEQGDWVSIAADRVPINNQMRTVSAEFLGEQAFFSQGPWILASLLKAPIYTGYILRQQGRFRFIFEKFSDPIKLAKGEKRLAQIQNLAQRYAHQLGSLCLRYPYQWFNFYHFWRKPSEVAN